MQNRYFSQCFCTIYKETPCISKFMADTAEDERESLTKERIILLDANIKKVTKERIKLNSTIQQHRVLRLFLKYRRGSRKCQRFLIENMNVSFYSQHKPLYLSYKLQTLCFCFRNPHTVPYPRLSLYSRRYIHSMPNKWLLFIQDSKNHPLSVCM